MKTHNFTGRRPNTQAALTIIEILAAIFAIAVPISIAQFIATHYGFQRGILGGGITAILCIGAVLLFYRVLARQHKERQRELRKKYRGVYRVTGLPTELDTVRKPDGAEIRVGDNGWEAEPLRNDGLTYLQGLTAQWHVVWYAGFRPEQIEKVDEKPQSQYDWNYSWVTAPPPCQFPVQPRKTPDMGFPLITRTALARKQG